MPECVEQVIRRAGQFELQLLAVEHDVQVADTELMGRRVVRTMGVSVVIMSVRSEADDTAQLSANGARCDIRKILSDKLMLPYYN